MQHIKYLQVQLALSGFRKKVHQLPSRAKQEEDTGGDTGAKSFCAVMLCVAVVTIVEPIIWLYVHVPPRFGVPKIDANSIGYIVQAEIL